MFQGHTHSLASSSNNLHYLFCGKCSRIGSALKRKKCWVILFPFAGARQFGGRQLCHNFNSSRSSECINETSLLQCDQTLDLKSCPNVFKSYLNNIQSWSHWLVISRGRKTGMTSQDDVSSCKLGVNVMKQISDKHNYATPKWCILIGSN